MTVPRAVADAEGTVWTEHLRSIRFIWPTVQRRAVCHRLPQLLGRAEDRDYLRWPDRVDKPRPGLKDIMLAVYVAKAGQGLDALPGVPATHSAGREFQREVKV